MVGLTIVYIICMAVVVFVGANVLQDLITLDHVQDTWYLLLSGIMIVAFAVGAGVYITVDYIRLMDEI